ncbi:maltase A2-like [Planococcus citri]|uniref:maltase A2-like n=1 Tax=Planococcus citri TaxID=170843 RepID=UPI0031F996D8
MNFLSILISSIFVSGAFAFDKDWWKHASIYQIYTRSFKDSDGDGIGDINGIISKLDYLVDIGVDTLYLNPFYPSAMADGGYDITDYKGIDPVYGTMEDFEKLIKELKSRDLYLVTDLVINHSSDKHEWFEKSVNKISPYTDYYVWADPKGYDQNGNPFPPNNWFNLFNLFKSGTAWQWNEKRKQFYLHQCMVEQPDLNLRNKAVKDEIKDIMKFWLDKGVAGFRVDAPMLFLEDELLRDNPPVSDDRNVFNIFSECENTLNHPDTYRFLNELNVFLRDYDRKSGKSIQTPLIGETYGDIQTVIKYFGTRRFPAFHLPLNFLITSMTSYLNARELHDLLQTWLNQVPKGMASSWALGNHDQGRISYRLNAEYNYIMLALVTMLPGTCQVYYGEELNMGQNNMVREKNRFNRNFHRTPMQWDDTRNAGFSTGEKTWLPVNPNYWNINVQSQKTHQNSSLNYFKDLMAIRRTEPIKYGDLKFHIASDWVLAFSRTFKQTSYIIIMNLGTETQPIDWLTEIDYIPASLTVVASSSNSGYKKGFKMEISPNYPSSSVLRPNSVIILSSK